MHRKAYKYRLVLNKTTEQALQEVLDRCRELYNAGMSERRDAWKYARQSLSCYQQINDLPQIKEIRPEYKQLPSHVLQDVLRRLDKTFQAFFRRVKNGEKVGYPRFKGKNWYDSFTYPDHAGWKLEGNKLHLSKIATVKVKLHREIAGKIKTCTIKKEGEHWYAIFSCEVEAEPLPASCEDVGIDLGVTHFAALSDAMFIEPPRYYRSGEKKLEKLQQSLSRKKRGSHRRKKAVKRLARAHRKIKNQRKDFLHKASRQVVNRYQVIVFEDLQTANLVKRPKPKQDEATGQYLPNGASAKAGLNKSIADAGWNLFTQMVSAKAASAGRTVIFVNPKHTSQICSGCRAIAKKTLEERWHSCDCGCELDRDTNAAKNILRLGTSLHGNVSKPPCSARR